MNNKAFISLLKELEFAEIPGGGFGFLGGRVYVGRIGQYGVNPLYIEIRGDKCRLALKPFPQEGDYIKEFEATAKGLIIAVANLRYKHGWIDKATEIRNALDIGV